VLRTAFRFIFYDKTKSLGSLLGVVVATFLIGQQMGVFIFLTDSMKRLVTLAPDAIWVVDDKTENVNSLGQLRMRVRYEVESLRGVKSVHPLFLGAARVQYPDGDNTPITVVGIESPSFAGAPAFFEGNAINLLPDGAVAIDVFDDAAFPSTEIGTTLEINGGKAYVAARTKGIRTFGGVLVFTTLERARFWANAPPDAASAFLVKAEPGQADEVIRRINATIFGVRAWKAEELASSTVSIILRTTSIAFSVGTLVVFAFVAGLFIVGLTLYSAAVDRLKDYGTMKAIGANNGYIRKLIFSQAAIFALLGYGLGYVLLLGFKSGIAQSGLLFEFSTGFLVTFFIGICTIALGGAILAVRRITSVEPAEVFRF
jgi:putative ABC transport system permease protein